MRLFMSTLAAVAITSAGVAAAQDAGDASKGLAYAQKVCSECHGVGAGDRVSPKLGLATFKTIANAPGMTGTALAVWLRTPHLAMPNLIIETEDRSNLIAYITSLRDDGTSK